MYPMSSSNLFAAWRVVRRHLRYAWRDPQKLLWIARRSLAVVMKGELPGVLARHATEADLYAGYPHWAAHAEAAIDIASITSRVAEHPSAPYFSIVMPVFDPPPAYREEAIDSVLAQGYPHWELLLIDDGSTRPEVRDVLSRAAEHDARVRLLRQKHNCGIVAASNAGISTARGDFVTFVDHDDRIASHALALVADAVLADGEVDFLYSDEDRIDERGRRQAPLFKSGWNRELLRVTNCVLHLMVIRTECLRAVGNMREGFDGVQDWDCALRVTEGLPRTRIRHLPHVLYHWRVHAGSTAAAPYEKTGMLVKQRTVMVNLLNRREERATIEMSNGGWHLRYQTPHPPPLVTLVIPTRDGAHLLRRCLFSVAARTSWPNWDVVIVDNESVEDATKELFAQLVAGGRTAIVPYRGEFNYAAECNLGVQEARGEFVILLNNDVEVISADWIDELIGLASRREVGIVGGMLYYPDDTIQHAGVILGLNGIGDRPYIGNPRGFRGVDGRLGSVQEVGALITACAALRRDRYLVVGGMDESFPVSCNDVDLCLRVRAHGFSVLWTPFAELYHHESASRGYDDSVEARRRECEDQRRLRTRWGDDALADPYYNPNLTLLGRAYGLASPPGGRMVTKTCETAATNGTLFSEPRPALPPLRSPPR
jgi:GT2 family glycosyltransferase